MTESTFFSANICWHCQDKAVEELGIVEFIVCLYIFIGWEIALNHEEFCVFMV